ncbi:MAG TPA: hypothetical protein VGL66_17460 [Caulobacteraceae bacterium]|jgi:hypothetical protein
MTADDVASRTLDIYLRKVRHGLRGLPDDEAKEIVDELRSHALDRAGGALTAASVDATIAGLGPARELSGLYLAERMAERVEVSRSPLLILKTVWRLAGLSVGAFFALILSFVGYAFGVSLLLTALLKPFLPKNDGLWYERRPTGVSMSFSITDHPTGHELMGWWIIPFGLICGAFVTWCTWRYGLWSVRRLGRARAAIVSRQD